MDGLDQSRMTVTNVMNIITMEVHIALAAMIFYPDSLRFSNGIETGSRNRLPEEILLITIEYTSRYSVYMLSLPHLPIRRGVNITFRSAGTLTCVTHYYLPSVRF